MKKQIKLETIQSVAVISVCAFELISKAIESKTFSKIKDKILTKFHLAKITIHDKIS